MDPDPEHVRIRICSSNCKLMQNTIITIFFGIYLTRNITWWSRIRSDLDLLVGSGIFWPHIRIQPFVRHNRIIKLRQASKSLMLRIVFLSRISIRMLIHQHTLLFEQNADQKTTRIGMIDPSCKVRIS